MQSRSYLNRRQFLQRSLVSATGMATAAATGLNLSVLSQRVQAAQFNDYKALVCIYLYGGNDSLNMLVPSSSEDYQSYQAVRQQLAIDPQQLTPLSPRGATRYAVATQSAMSGVVDLFAQRRLSFVANVGTLLAPVSKADVLANTALAPPQLFSHNDQQLLWQSGTGNTNAYTGWAGRMADALLDPEAKLAMNLSLDGNSVWQTGYQSLPFAMSAYGPDTIEGLDGRYEWNQPRLNIYRRLLQSAQPHPLEQHFSERVQSAMRNSETMQLALDAEGDSAVIYPEDNQLAFQLRMVAKLARIQQQLGQQRQIFYVGMGGWDTHDNQAAYHPTLLGQLSEALQLFHADLEAANLADSVTSFTMSEFGRTSTSNGDGTDHGWGGHHMVMGGAVAGGHIFGELPALELNSDDDLSDGRIIPSLSVEQYCAPMARWFGLPESELAQVFPNIGRFDSAAVPLMSA